MEHGLFHGRDDAEHTSVGFVKIFATRDVFYVGREPFDGVRHDPGKPLSIHMHYWENSATE